MFEIIFDIARKNDLVCNISTDRIAGELVFTFCNTKNMKRISHTIYNDFTNFDELEDSIAEMFRKVKTIM